MASFIFVLALLSVTLYHTRLSFAEGNIACADSGMDWYSNAVGETPCRTYERLRQICNDQYEVGIQNVNTPPDSCMEQVADCCCNSIAFALSMLCLTCQQGFSKSSTGYDAGKGAYQDYLTGSRTTGFCSPNTNQTFTPTIQSAVCNQGIKIFDALYGIFWGDGSWYYEYTAQTLQKDIAAEGQGAWTHCGTTLSSSSSPPTQSTLSSTAQIQSTNPASTPSSTTPSSSANAPPTSTETCTHCSSTATSLSSGTSTPLSAPIFPDTITTSSPPGTSSSLPEPIPNADSSNESQNKHRLSAGAMGGIIAAAVGVVIICGLFFWYLRHKKSEKIAAHTTPFLSEKGQENADSATYLPVATTASMTEFPIIQSQRSPSSGEDMIPYSPPPSHSEMWERHIDAGPVPPVLLGRHGSGRLPPAYGEQYGEPSSVDFETI